MITKQIPMLLKYKHSLTIFHQQFQNNNKIQTQKQQKFKNMQSQIQQMKSSIANIQHHLRKLQHEQTIKTSHCNQNQIHQDILPQSIIHEHTYQKPTPTPKVTNSIPNIIHTDIYTPNRHHLDDTQMKKVLRDPVNEELQPHIEKNSKNKDQNNQHQHRNNKKLHKKSSSKSRQSSTIKTNYIFDGNKVIYVPPPRQNYSDYGNIVLEFDRKNKHKSYLNQHYSQNHHSQLNKSPNYKALHQYGTLPISNTPKNNKRQHKKQKKHSQKTQHKNRKQKISTNKNINYHMHTHIQHHSHHHSHLQQSHYTNQSKNSKKNHEQSSEYQRRIKQFNQKQFAITKNKRHVELKSIKVQCNIKKLKIKGPFILDWDPDTDSQFSGMEL